MKRPDALSQLIDTLRTESGGLPGTVVTIAGSYADIFPSGDDDCIRLNPEECELIFEDSSNIERLHDALGMPDSGDIELHKIELTEEVREAIQELFTLDEG